MYNVNVCKKKESARRLCWINKDNIADTDIKKQGSGLALKVESHFLRAVLSISRSHIFCIFCRCRCFVVTRLVGDVHNNLVYIGIVVPYAHFCQMQCIVCINISTPALLTSFGIFFVRCFVQTCNVCSSANYPFLFFNCSTSYICAFTTDVQISLSRY